MADDNTPEMLAVQRASEERWRAWEAKGRRRDLMFATRMRHIGLVLTCCAAITLAYYFGTR
jgi:hypothetical protein